MEDNIKLRVNVLVQTRRKDGTIIDEEEIHNIVVNSGKERVAKLINNVSSTYFRAIAIGTGTNTALVTNTTLQTEVKRGLATLSYEANYKAVFEATFACESGESFAITEAGVFDSADVSGSVMLNRGVFSAKNIDQDTDLYIKITIAIS